MLQTFALQKQNDVMTENIDRVTETIWKHSHLVHENHSTLMLCLRAWFVKELRVLHLNTFDARHTQHMYVVNHVQTKQQRYQSNVRTTH